MRAAPLTWRTPTVTPPDIPNQGAAKQGAAEGEGTMNDDELSVNAVHILAVDDAIRALREIGLVVLAGQVQLARAHFAAELAKDQP